MKKEYSKPIVVFEDFALSTNIAGDCEIKTDLQSKNACGVDASGIQVFMTGMTGCFFEVPSDGGGDGDDLGGLHSGYLLVGVLPLFLIRVYHKADPNATPKILNILLRSRNRIVTFTITRFDIRRLHRRVT